MYSKKLIKEVKECYPDFELVNELAKDGNPFLGRLLCDSCKTSIPIKTILNASSLEQLQSLAIIEQRKLDLYEMWKEEIL